MNESVTIAKKAALSTSQDYMHLRQLALAFLQKFGNEAWTDYNLHDPGITFLELLAYGITDLSYRQNLPMESLLAVDINGDINADAQALFTPAKILTTNPLTIDDYRLLLIDIARIQNAWLSVNKTPGASCGWPLYVDCKTQSLSYTETPNSVIYGGLYDVQLQLDSDSSLGNLNSGSVVYHFVLPLEVDSPPLPGSLCGIDLANNYDGYMEMRFEAAGVVSNNPLYTTFMDAGTIITAVTGLESLTQPGQYEDILITEAKYANTAIAPARIQNYLGANMFASFLIHYLDSNNTAGILQLNFVPFRVFFYDSNGKMIISLSDIQKIIAEHTDGGLVATYQAKLRLVETAVESARFVLNEHRNYCEDFCNISLIPTEDFAICCDIDATTDANLEEIQRAIYAGVMKYLNPSLNFFSWQDLFNEGYNIDQIFNGPRISCGFVKPGDLDKTALREEIFTADLIRIIYEIPGVIGVTNFTIVRIDANGSAVEFQPWQMNVTPGRLPDLYVYSSNIQFKKNSLPFSTNFSQLLDSIGIITNSSVSHKLSTLELDVPLPTGKLLDLSAYYPLMYSLPQVYNVSPSGPMPPFTDERFAQTRQLQAYLLFFEQIYANWLAQVGNLKDFFSIQFENVSTYFNHFISEQELPGVASLYGPCYNETNLQSNGESIGEFNDRKNRIYNHLMARLGENNNDYTMMSNSLNNSDLLSPSKVLAEKARLLRKYPEASYNKARALNYRYNTPLASSVVHEGLIDKLCDLLGLDSLNDFFHWEAVENDPSGNYRLVANSFSTPVSIVFNIYLTVQPQNDVPAVLTEENYNMAIGAIDRMLNPLTAVEPWQDTHGNFYVVGGFTAIGGGFVEECRLTTAFSSGNDALAARSGLAQELNKFWISNMILPLEHILLRPLSAGEPTLDTCIPADCMFCGDEDPYSFRMTFIMCGETGYPGYNLDFRAYAEKLIRTEIPAHILLKVCWLSAEDCIALTCLYSNYVNSISCSANSSLPLATGIGSGSGWPVLDTYDPPFVTSVGFDSGRSGSGSGAWAGWIGSFNGCGISSGSGSGSGMGLEGCVEQNVTLARTLLVNKLNNIRSLFPPAVLNDCSGNSPFGLVYLGKTII